MPKRRAPKCLTIDGVQYCEIMDDVEPTSKVNKTKSMPKPKPKKTDAKKASAALQKMKRNACKIQTCEEEKAEKRKAAAAKRVASSPTIQANNALMKQLGVEWATMDEKTKKRLYANKYNVFVAANKGRFTKK